MVERYLVGWTTADVEALLGRIAELAAHFTAHGVRYVRSVVVAGDETCLCLFEGAGAEPIRLANEAAGLPTHRVVPAVLTCVGEERP